jgi:hypothetical protein
MVWKWGGGFIAVAFQLWLRICHYEGQRKHLGMKLTDPHQLLLYGDDVNLLGENKDINTEALLALGRRLVRT